MADIFDEIRDDLRAERAQNLLRRYGLLLVIACVLVIAGVAAWQVLRARANEQSAAVAAQFLDAMDKATGPQAQANAATPTRDAAAAEFESVAKNGPDGYRTLARLRAAAILANAPTPNPDNQKSALQMWDDIARDPQADPLLKGLAALLWAQNQLDAGEPAAIESHLAALVVPGNPWRPLAVETQALLALRTGNDARARDLLKQVAADPMAPTGARARAGALLTRMGEAPTQPDAGPIDLAPNPTTEIGG